MKVLVGTTITEPEHQAIKLADRTHFRTLANDLRSTNASVVTTSQNFARGNRHRDALTPFGGHKALRLLIRRLTKPHGPFL